MICLFMLFFSLNKHYMCGVCCLNRDLGFSQESNHSVLLASRANVSGKLRLKLCAINEDEASVIKYIRLVYCYCFHELNLRQTSY